jgi:hypothetical protein
MEDAVTCDGSRPEDLATKWAISGKELRDWLRKTYPRDAQDHGANWYLTHEQVEKARRRFGPTL